MVSNKANLNNVEGNIAALYITQVLAIFFGIWFWFDLENINLIEITIVGILQLVVILKFSKGIFLFKKHTAFIFILYSISVLNLIVIATNINHNDLDIKNTKEIENPSNPKNQPRGK